MSGNWCKAMLLGILLAAGCHDEQRTMNFPPMEGAQPATHAGARWALVTMGVEFEDFELAVSQLRELVGREQAFVEEIESDPEYTALIASPAYQAWKAEGAPPPRESLKK